MKKTTNNFIAGVLITILTILLIPASAFAVYENIQIVHTDENYVVYIEGMEDKNFQYATSNGTSAQDPDDVSLNYIASVKDENGAGENSVAVLDGTEKYLYVKEGTNTSVITLDFSNAIEKSYIDEVENTTKRIETELATDLIEREETVNGVEYKETVGGLIITDDQNASYEYISVKLPAAKYSELQELANKLNDISSESMYEKIKFAKEFYELYNELISNATDWQNVEDMQIRQPLDAQNGDRYIVLLKKVANRETTYDAKFMLSYRADEEEKIPGRTETKTVKETAKLPITGESIAIFAILLGIIVALVIVFIRIKTLKNKDNS